MHYENKNYKDSVFRMLFRDRANLLELYNAINKTNVIDFNGQAACYYGLDGLSDDHSDCTSFFNQLTKNLNIQKTCKGHAKADGCVPTYSSYPTSSGCTGYSESRINETDYAYVLSDGQIIITYMSMNSENGALFLIDINGFKGPNKYGYDLFSFDIRKSQKKSLHLATGRCYLPETGGRTTEEMIKHAFAGQE